MTKRQSIKLLGELLLDRANYNVMMAYVESGENLKLCMKLLRDDRKMVQYEGFHVFKVGQPRRIHGRGRALTRGRYSWPIRTNRWPYSESSSTIVTGYCGSCPNSWRTGPRTTNSQTRRASWFGRLNSYPRSLLTGVGMPSHNLGSTQPPWHKLDLTAGTLDRSDHVFTLLTILSWYSRACCPFPLCMDS